KDVNIFDKLFVENQDYFKELSLYIAAGEEKLQEAHATTLPQLKAEAETSGDQHKVQAYKDMEQHVVRFERRIHSLRRSRVVVLESARQIGLRQKRSSSFSDKLLPSCVNTIPLWKNQLLLTLGGANPPRALEAQKGVTEAMNVLLRPLADVLQEATVN